MLGRGPKCYSVIESISTAFDPALHLMRVAVAVVANVASIEDRFLSYVDFDATVLPTCC